MDLLFWLLLTLTLSDHHCIFFKRNFKLVHEKVDVESDPNYISANSSIRIDNGVSKISASYNLKVDLLSPINVQYSFKHFVDGTYVNSFLSVKIEFCELLKQVLSNPLAKRVYSDLRQKGKIPNRCPVKKDVYLVVDFPAPVHLFPEILLTTKYCAETIVSIPVDGKPLIIMKNLVYLKFMPINEIK